MPTLTPSMTRTHMAEYIRTPTVLDATEYRQDREADTYTPTVKRHR